MHYLFLDESNVLGRAQTIMGAWAVEQDRLNRYVQRLSDLFRPPVIEAMKAMLQSVDAEVRGVRCVLRWRAFFDHNLLRIAVAPDSGSISHPKSPLGREANQKTHGILQGIRENSRLIDGQSAASVSRPSGEALRPASQAAQRVGDSAKTSNTRPPGSLGEFCFPIELDSPFMTPEDSQTIPTG